MPFYSELNATGLPFHYAINAYGLHMQAKEILQPEFVKFGLAWKLLH